VSHFIGPVELTTINSVAITDSRNDDDIEILKNDRLLFEEERNISKILIEFSLVEGLHSDDKIVEEQRKDVKTLAENKAPLNDFSYGPLSGYISVTDVSVPEVADSDTIRQGTITGYFLAWPKNYPNAPEPGTPGVSTSTDVGTLSVEGIEAAVQTGVETDIGNKQIGTDQLG
jgi:hypothetical protein